MKPRLPRRPWAALVLAALAPAHAAAQLPAPPASAPGAFSAGGYAAVTLLAPRSGTADADLDLDLHEAAAALLVSGTPWQRLSYFAEIEGASVSRETFSGREDERWLEVERAYLELSASDALRLRVGRFLTPVGQWNEIHAAPLTWTAVRPLTTYRAFAKSTTGAMLAGHLGLGPRDAGYAVWSAPFGEDPRGEGEENAFVRAAGARIAIELAPELYVGVSGASFRASRVVGGAEPEDPDDEDDRLAALRPTLHAPSHAEDPEDPEDPEAPDDDDRDEDHEARALAGADLSWRRGGFHLLAEATWLSASEDVPSEAGAFVQAAVPLGRRVHLVGRAEVYDPVVTGPLAIYNAGLAWRPTPRLVLKLERQATDRPSRRAADGWLVSLSGLF